MLGDYAEMRQRLGENDAATAAAQGIIAAIKQ
jgi:hypothetical protein